MFNSRLTTYDSRQKKDLPRSAFLIFLRSKNKAKPWQKSTAGFTLVELMVAATLVMVVFGSILALVNYSIYAVTFIQNNLIASFLAQEGVELVIKRRSENWVSGRAFGYGLEPGSYRVDYQGVFDNPQGIGTLKFDETLGYQYAVGQSTSFDRTITIDVVSQDQLRVTSEVLWKSKAKNFSIAVEDHLYNWFGVEQE